MTNFLIFLKIRNNDFRGKPILINIIHQPVQGSATRVQSQHAGFSARTRFARVLACNLLIFKNPARARRARVLSVRMLCAHAFCTQKQKKRKILQKNGKLLVSTKFRLVSF